MEPERSGARASPLTVHARVAGGERPERKAKVGVVGCGKIAERHLNAYRHLSGVEVTVFDADVARAVARANEFDVTYTPNLSTLLDDPSVAAIDVCVPTTEHYRVVMQALEHGKHVFCEKPLCQTYEQAEAIHRRARETGLMVMVGYLYRFYPAFELVKQLLDEGVLGTPYFAILRVGGRGGAAEWKHRRDAGGGALTEMLVHNLDLATWFFGEIWGVERLWESTLLPHRAIGAATIEADAEDVIVVRVQAGTVNVLCEGDLLTPSYMNSVEIQGTNGSIFASLLHYLPTIVHLKEPRGIYNVGNNVYTFPMVNVFEKQLGRFIATIEGRELPFNHVGESLRLMQVLDGLASDRTSAGVGNATAVVAE
jgi:predicted dehydrogenase